MEKSQDCGAGLVFESGRHIRELGMNVQARAGGAGADWVQSGNVQG